MKGAYTIPGVQFVIADTRKGEVLITRVEVIRERRGKGYGRALLKAMLEDTDREGVTLHLHVDADHSLGSLSQDDLRDWYQRYGFRPVLDPDDPYALTRAPVVGCATTQ